MYNNFLILNLYL